MTDHFNVLRADCEFEWNTVLEMMRRYRRGGSFFRRNPRDILPIESRVGGSPGFSLVEILVVIAIIALLTGFMAPIFTSLKGAGEITKSAHDLANVLEIARAHAITHNTYVWVGFFEENGFPLTGTSEIVISVVASRDGLQGFDPNASESASNSLSASRLIQLGKLIRMGNIRLASFSDGLNTGEDFDTRPAVGSNEARIGGTNPPSSSKFPFQYPVGNPAPSPKYTFKKTLQFNPRGECRVNSTYDMRPVVEIGLQPIHNKDSNTKNKNACAVQISGVAGTVKIYRQ